MDTGRAPLRSGVEVRKAAAVFARPSGRPALLRLPTTFGPVVAACVAMYLACPIAPLLDAALALSAGVLLVRVCSLLTMTPSARSTTA